MAAVARRGSPLRVRMLETEPSSATWTSRTTSPARCAARASGGYSGSMRLWRSSSAWSGVSRTLGDEALLVGAILFVVLFLVAISVVEVGPTTESLSGLVGLSLAWRCLADSVSVGVGFKRKITFPFSYTTKSLSAEAAGIADDFLDAFPDAFSSTLSDTFFAPLSDSDSARWSAAVAGALVLAGMSCCEV